MWAFNLAKKESCSAAIFRDASSEKKRNLSQRKYNGSINLVSIELSNGSPVCAGRQIFHSSSCKETYHYSAMQKSTVPREKKSWLSFTREYRGDMYLLPSFLRVSHRWGWHRASGKAPAKTRVYWPPPRRLTVSWCTADTNKYQIHDYLNIV